MAENVETAIYRLQVEGQSKLGELKSHVDGLAASVEKGDGKNRKYSEGLQTTIAKSDATTRAYENMRKALESFEKYAESGKGTQQQLAAYYDITNQKIAVQTKNLEQLAAAQAQANRLAKSTDYGTQFGPSTGQFQQAAQYKAEDAIAFGNQVTARLVPELKKSAHISGAVFVQAFEDEMSKLANIAQLKAAQAGQNFQRSLNEHFRVGAAPGKSARDSFAVFDEAGMTNANKTMDQLGHSTKVARYEMINLGRQAQDVVVSLASGQNILMVGLQQGSQVLDVFLSSERSVADVFKQIGSGIVNFLTNPLTIALGTVTALTAGVLLLANAWDKAQVAANRSISGAGARTGTTIADQNAFVDRTASAGGTGLSDKEARQLAQAYTAAGDIVIGKLNGMSDAVVGFANLSGKSIDEAIKDFVRFGSDPIKAMEELGKVHGVVDDKTRDLVERFVTAGDKTAALSALVAGLAEQSKKAAQEMGFLESIWRRITTLAGKETAAPVGLEGQQKAAQDRLIALESAPRGTGGQGQYGPSAEDIKAATDEVMRLNAEMGKNTAEVFAAQMRQVSDQARQVTEAVIPQIEQIRNLEQQLVKLRAAEAAGGGSPDLSAAIQAIELTLQKTRATKDETALLNEETARLREKWGTVSDEVNRSAELLQKNIAVTLAVGDAAQRAAQFEADKAAELAKQVPMAQAVLNATIKRVQSEAQSLASVRDATRALEEQNELARARNISDEKRIASAQAYDKVIKQLGDNEKGREEALKRSDAVAESYRIKMKQGADATSGAAGAALTLANNVGFAASSADTFAQNMMKALNTFQSGGGQSLLSALNSAGSSISWQQGQSMAEAENASIGQGSAFTPTIMPDRPLSYVNDWARLSDPYVLEQERAIYDINVQSRALKAYASGGTAGALASIVSAPNITGLSGSPLGHPFKGYDVTQFFGPERSIVGEKISAYDQIVQLMNQQTTDKSQQAANIQSELEWLQTLPASIERDQKIASLTSSIDGLIKSTDSLNATNTELLSPYYTQDPRTSKIGFRSQGMADGGYVDVPGGFSANDNMLAMVPVASGERIYVDPNTSRRGGAGGTTINISAPMTFTGPVNRDEVGRTVYQTMQNTARSIQAASR